MNITRSHLRDILFEMVTGDSDGDGVSDAEEIALAWTFAPTAAEEAKKLNDQLGSDMYSTDQAYWDERDVSTGDEFAHFVLSSTVWDLFYQLEGIRPRFMNFDDMSPKDLQDEINNLNDQLEAKAQREPDEGWESDIEDERRDAERDAMDILQTEIESEFAEEELMRTPESEYEHLGSKEPMKTRGWHGPRGPGSRYSTMREAVGIPELRKIILESLPYDPATVFDVWEKGPWKGGEPGKTSGWSRTKAEGDPVGRVRVDDPQHASDVMIALRKKGVEVGSVKPIYDSDGDGVVDWDEFLALVKDLAGGEERPPWYTTDPGR